MFFILPLSLQRPVDEHKVEKLLENCEVLGHTGSCLSQRDIEKLIEGDLLPAIDRSETDNAVA